MPSDSLKLYDLMDEIRTLAESREDIDSEMAYLTAARGFGTIVSAYSHLYEATFSWMPARDQERMKKIDRWLQNNVPGQALDFAKENTMDKNSLKRFFHWGAAPRETEAPFFRNPKAKVKARARENVGYPLEDVFTPEIYPYGQESQEEDYKVEVRSAPNPRKSVARLKKTPRKAGKSVSAVGMARSRWQDTGYWPIGDAYHGRVALAYVLSGHDSKRHKIIRAVARQWPQYDWASWWNKQINKSKHRGKGLMRWSSYFGKKQYKMAANPKSRSNAGRPKRAASMRGKFAPELRKLASKGNAAAKRELDRRAKNKAGKGR